MQHRLSLALIAGLSLGGCVVEADDTTFEQDDFEVQGGVDERDFNHPWVVRVVSPGVTCHGVLIHPSWVLTAAHCIPSVGIPEARYARTDPYTGQVHSGSRYAAYNPQQLIYVHPGYDGGFSDDIALFKLETPFVLDRYIQPAALPTGPAALGQLGAIASYISHGDPLPSGYMAVMRGEVWDGQYCGASGPEFCVQADNAEACPGDSGSAFVRQVGATLTTNGRATATGIASNTVANYCGPEDLGLPVTMMDVYAYRDWIAQTTGISLASFAGDARARWDGQPSRGLITVRCESSPFGTTTKTTVAPMNARGAEARLDCPSFNRMRVTCNLGGDPAAQITSFKVTTRNLVTGAVTTTSQPYTANSATYVSPYDLNGTIVRDVACRVGGVNAPL